VASVKFWAGLITGAAVLVGFAVPVVHRRPDRAFALRPASWLTMFAQRVLSPGSIRRRYSTRPWIVMASAACAGPELSSRSHRANRRCFAGRPVGSHAEFAKALAACSRMDPKNPIC